MPGDFEMIKTLMTVRLNKAVQQEQRRINDYNLKANEARLPIINKITKHYADSSTFKHPLGNPFKNDWVVRVNFCNESEVMIDATSQESDGKSYCNINLRTYAKLTDEFAAELKKFPLLNNPAID